jgi:hypothetical protein
MKEYYEGLVKVAEVVRAHSHAGMGEVLDDKCKYPYIILLHQR